VLDARLSAVYASLSASYSAYVLEIFHCIFRVINENVVAVLWPFLSVVFMHLVYKIHYNKGIGRYCCACM